MRSRLYSYFDLNNFHLKWNGTRRLLRKLNFDLGISLVLTDFCVTSVIINIHTSYLPVAWFHNFKGVAVVLIVWSSAFQLPVQSVSINTNVVSSNPAHGEVYSIQHYVIKFDRAVVFSGFLHQWNWPPGYNWNIVESGTKQYYTPSLISIHDMGNIMPNTIQL